MSEQPVRDPNTRTSEQPVRDPNTRTSEQPPRDPNTRTSEQPPRDPNTIYVGKKPVMNYVLACLTVLQSGADSVTVKARGRTISTAVDVAQILTKRFATDVGIKNIAIDTEQVKSVETGQTSNVSSIEIIMGK